MTDRRTTAILAAHWLEFAGLDVEYFDHVNVVVVLYNGNRYFAGLETNIKFGISFIKCNIHALSETTKMAIITFDDVDDCKILLRTELVSIGDVKYVGPNYYLNVHFGYIDGNKFIDFTDKNTIMPDNAFKPNPSPDYLEIGIVPQEFRPNDILCTLNLLPVQPKEVNILNEGSKLVKFLPIINWVDVFTVIGSPDFGGEYIADMKLIVINNGPFRYMDTSNNEEFALLFDEQTNESYLASSNKIIKLTSIKMYEVKPVDGLYCGLQIHNNMADLAYYENVEGDYIDFDGNPADAPVPCIYYYNFILFAFGMTDGKLIKLEATNPTNGMETKSAVCDIN